jgi:aryl-alcohol dehydrogenase-like predicted oxidoreductase
MKIVKRSEEKGCTAAQFAVAWVLYQPGITAPILGPRNLEQLEDLLPAMDVEFDDDDLKFCDTLVPPGTHLTSFFNTSMWIK